MATKTATKTATQPTLIDESNNNKGRPSVPSSTETENTAVLTGTEIDWDAPITKSQLADVKAARGRSGIRHLKDKDVKHVAQAVMAITDTTDSDGNVTEVATPDDELTFVIQCKNHALGAYKTQIESEARKLAPFAVEVTFNKHALSPFTATTKKDDAQNDLVYMFTISRKQYTVLLDEENTEESAAA
jgi:hypothetical protein